MALHMKLIVLDVVNEPHVAEPTERIQLSAAAGPGNELWSKYTPYAVLNATITNPAAHGQLKRGQAVYLDITPIEEEAPAAAPDATPAPEIPAPAPEG